MLWRFAGAPDPFGLLAIDGAISRERGSHADVREGVASFLEKRPPTFPGKVSGGIPSQYPWWGGKLICYLGGFRLRKAHPA